MVYGWYQDYIPTYIYSILTAFPQHYVKVFLKESLNNANRSCLDLMPNKNFEVVENFNDFDKCEILHAAAERFLLTREYFDGFDYIYMGDVDFIIYDQFNEPNFYDRYVKHAESVGLPFSNEWNYDWGGKFRMTGLHFMIKDPYFDVMDSFIEDMKKPKNEFKRECIYTPLWPSYDEEMLFYMAMRAFNLQPLTGYRRPFHGMHWGTFRLINFGDAYCADEVHVTDGKNNLPQWLEDLPKISPVIKSEAFKKFYAAMGKEAREVVNKTKMTLYRKTF